MLFYELYKIMVNKVTFVGFFWGGNRPTRPPGSAPDRGTDGAITSPTLLGPVLV